MQTSRIGGLVLALALVASPAAAADEKQDDGAVVNDILQVLKERGIVDEGEYQRMAAKNARYEQEKEGFLPKIEWWGDFRFRHESFFYGRDDAGNDRNNRFRIRYRFRLSGKVNVNEYADVIFRLASGDNDDRSTNQTLGSGPDFDTDDIRLDRAYAKLTAPQEWSPFGGKWVAEIGKVPNPFVWKEDEDYMLWDRDINPEGVSLRYKKNFSDATRTFANFGYYIIDENSRNSDPHMWGLQGGVLHDLNEDVTLGGRATYYEFRSVDGNFIERGASGASGVTSAKGNVRDGIADGVPPGPIRVVHLTGVGKYKGFENWPIMAFAEWSKNLEATSSSLFNAGSEDTAWGVGFEVGDKKKWVKLGFGYYHIEANAFPAQFIDSDMFDGRTNQEGPVVYASRRILKNTDLNLTLFSSDVIDGSILPVSEQAQDSNRVRIMADMVFKF